MARRISDAPKRVTLTEFGIRDSGFGIRDKRSAYFASCERENVRTPPPSFRLNQAHLTSLSDEPQNPLEPVNLIDERLNVKAKTFNLTKA